MQIYVVHATAFDYANELYQPLQQLATENVRFIFPHQQSATPEHSQTLIQQSDLVIAEVSYPSTGSGIELAWAQAAAAPIICIHHINKKPSSSLSFISDTFIAYTDTCDLIEKINSRLLHQSLAPTRQPRRQT